VAMTLLLYSMGERCPIVFADTGGEWPETYSYLERFKEFIWKEWGAKITTLRKQPPLYDYLHEKGFTPSFRLKMCTDRWKVRPIKKAFPDAVTYLGYTVEEEKRIERKRRAKDALFYSFPLAEAGMNRADCGKFIKRFGLPVPQRSNCFFCALQTKEQWELLKRLHPDLFRKARELERRHREIRGVDYRYIKL